MEDAARRLIGVMDERAKKKASGAWRPEKFADQPAVSRVSAEESRTHDVPCASGNEFNEHGQPPQEAGGLTISESREARLSGGT